MLTAHEICYLLAVLHHLPFLHRGASIYVRKFETKDQETGEKKDKHNCSDIYHIFGLTAPILFHQFYFSRNQKLASTL